jgi:transcriptional antiterminator RfaH
MRRWYLIRTKPSSEELAHSNLERQRYDVYLPRAIQTFRRAAARYERIGALFPRYLFMRLHEGQQALGPVASTVGVAGIVRFGTRYAIVPDAVVGDLKARADPVTGLHRLSHGRKLTTGTPVRVTRGPFDGLQGIFEREAGSERVVILLKMLGHMSPVCVAAESITLSHAV